MFGNKNEAPYLDLIFTYSTGGNIRHGIAPPGEQALAAPHFGGGAAVREAKPHTRRNPEGVTREELVARSLLAPGSKRINGEPILAWLQARKLALRDVQQASEPTQASGKTRHLLTFSFVSYPLDRVEDERLRWVALKSLMEGQNWHWHRASRSNQICDFIWLSEPHAPN